MPRKRLTCRKFKAFWAAIALWWQKGGTVEEPLNRCINPDCDGLDSRVCNDYVVPLGRAGSNRQPLCLTCNLKKGMRTVDYRK